MLQPAPKYLEQKIARTVMRDLDPSWISVQTRLGLSAILGGILSLLVCGQFGMGLTDFATALSAKVHAEMGPFHCAAVCGSMYAIFPVAFLRLILCRPMQFKVIIRRHWHYVAAWYGGFGLATAFFGHHGNGILELAFWVFAALVVTNILAFLLNRIIPCWQMPDVLTRHLDF